MMPASCSGKALAVSAGGRPAGPLAAATSTSQTRIRPPTQTIGQGYQEWRAPNLQTAQLRYPDDMGRAAVGVLLLLATLAFSQPAAFAQQVPPGPSKTLTFRFPAGTSLRAALTFISESSGIGINFESTFTDSKTNSVIDLQDVTFEEALATVLPTNGL